MMKKIVQAHFENINEELVDQAIESLYRIRDVRGLQKKPSTSELIDWIRAMEICGVDIGKIGEEFPLIGVLLKKNEDTDTLKKALERAKNRW